MKKKRSANSIERRRNSRADAQLSMRVESGTTDVERTQIVTETQNISASGVYCTSLHYLAPASKVELTIVLPRLPGGEGAKELIKCEGIVVRCESPTRGERGERGYELACMFLGLDERRRILLEEFVTWRNLQSLRAAPPRGNGARTPTARTAKRKTKRAARGASARRTLH